MRELLAQVLTSPVSLQEDEWRERPVDRLHAIACAQASTGRYNLSLIGRHVFAFYVLPPDDKESGPALVKAREALANALLAPGHKLGLTHETAHLVALQALREGRDATCRTCKGRKDAMGFHSVPDVKKLAGWREGDGPVPMTLCPACDGTGKHRFSDREREQMVGADAPKAFSVAHSLISRAIDTLERKARKLLRG